MIASTLRKTTAKTAAYTLKLNQPDRSGFHYTNRGATGSVTFTLMAPSAAILGTWFSFEVIADQTLIVASPSAGQIVTSGNAAADNVGFQTASAKIGGRILAVCDGTSWLLNGYRAGGGFCVNGTEVAGTSGATSAELAVLHGVVAGTVTASKGLVVDANKALDVLNVVALSLGAGAGTPVTATAAELNTLHSVTAGTVAASSALVADANKAVDTLRATTTRSLGGTGVPGAANVASEFTKEVTAIADATATAVLTVTVPNAAHACMLDIAVIGRLGAGGAIGADEAVQTSRYQCSIVRTAGVASVCTLSSQLGAVAVAVAGAATVTATLSITNTGEGVGVTNTHVVKVTITRSGGSSANHKCDLHVRVHNANVTGVTVA